MKYWFFDGSDVIGPFSLKELTQNKSFSETSLVCPEDFSDDGDHWQVAATFDDFKPLFAHTAPADETTPTFEQEMDTLLKEASPLAFDETPSEGPGLQIPKKPAKPGPIEDYFNRIKEEDLGDILGIPNPNENSDMDLAHALEKQLAKTSSTRRREREQESETDQQTADELQKANQTHHVATATEVFATKAPVAVKEENSPSMPLVELPTMPVVATPIQHTATAHSDQPEELVATPTQPQTTQPDADLPSQPKEPEKPAPQSESIVPDPAQLRREKVEVNSIRTHLKQTQQMKDFLHETQNSRLKRETRHQRRVIVMLVTALVIVGSLWVAFQLRPQQTVTTAQTGRLPVSTAQELLDQPPNPPATVMPAAPAPAAAAPATQNVNKEQKALEIVKNYLLSGQRGTLANYLNRIYKSQLAQGYTGTWAAEPLYKNTYIVKYQLTKTRKEPIIYVFQADVAQGKLTGALNNISLDLIGKL